MTVTETSEVASMRDYQPGAVALRDTWVPVIQLSHIGRRPLRRAIHGHPVFVWREGGRLRVTEDSPLDIEQGRGRHGELTGGTGDYPLEQRYGYAWVWFGNPDAASVDLIPMVPHIPVEGVPKRMQGGVIFDCSYELVCENLLDLTHADFLHSELTGDPLAENDEIMVSSTSETVTMVREAFGRQPSKLQKRFIKDSSALQHIRLTTLVHVRSGVCILHGDYNPGPSIRMLHPCNPETKTRSRTPVSYNPKYIPWFAREMFPFTDHMVGKQDNWALRPQNIHYVRHEDEKDLSSRFDRAGLRYRRVYQDLVARQQKGDFSYLVDGDPGRDVTEEMGIDLDR